MPKLLIAPNTLTHSIWSEANKYANQNFEIFTKFYSICFRRMVPSLLLSPISTYIEKQEGFFLEIYFLSYIIYCKLYYFYISYISRKVSWYDLNCGKKTFYVVENGKKHIHISFWIFSKAWIIYSHKYFSNSQLKMSQSFMSQSC